MTGAWEFPVSISRPGSFALPRAPDLDLAGPIPATFKISSFSAPASTSAKPTRREVTLDELVKLLTTHERRRNKDGRGWSGATYKPGTTRANANVIEWSVAGSDFDRLSMDDYTELRERLVGAGLTFIVYSTYSSTESDFHFRLAIPLTKPVPKARYADIWHRMNAHLFGGKNDPQTKDPSRMLYLPAAPEGVTTVAEYVPGLALEWENLPEAPAQMEPASGGSVFGQDVGIGRQTLEFIALGAPDGQQRGAALRATRSLLAAGYSVEDTAQKVWQGLQASPVGKADDPWTYEHALEFAEDFAKRKPTPLEEWPELKLNGRIKVNGQPNGKADGAVIDFEGYDGFRTVATETTSTADGASTNEDESTDEPPTPATKEPTFAATEMGASELLVHLHGGDLRFSHPWGQWLDWDGRRYRRDLTGEARRRAKQAIRSVYAEAAKIGNDKQRKAIVEWARKLEKSATVAAMLKLAEVEPGIPILPEEMDRDSFLLNVMNGTVDLRTGQIHPHDRADNITKLAPVYFDPEATCPTFLAFLERVLPDPDVRAFLQRMTGYAMTGDTSEQCLCFMCGGGANGKSTFLGVIQHMLGDYARQAAPELLVSRGGDRHPTELADLFGARLVTSIEVDEGKRLAETLTKQMTGGDPMKARFMRQDFFQWIPTHKLFLAANHRPEIRGTDHAIWRRIHLVPFTVTIPKPERDRRLPERLLAELSGILNWVIAGCLDWQRNGLGVPQAVEDATEAYRQEQDILADFLNERCVIDPQAWAKASDLYKSYAVWCEEGGDKPVSTTAFGRRLTERGFRAARGGRPQTRGWKGLRLRLPDEPVDTFEGEDRFRHGFADQSSDSFYEDDIGKTASNPSKDENVSTPGDGFVCFACGGVEVPLAGLECDDCISGGVR
jgi:P4 family phage/plasmid primase-like protien